MKKKAGNHPFLMDSTTSNGHLNIYALMVSDQCPWHLIFRNRGKEFTFTGPLPLQVESCILRISDYNPTIDAYNKAAACRKFPAVAIRECVVNAVIHFDASVYEDIIIEIRNDLLTVTSPGMMDTEGNSTSGPRNRRLGNLMKILRYADLSYSGIDAVRSCYRFSGMMPSFRNEKGYFTAYLPSLGSKSNMMANNKDHIRENLRSKPGILITDLASLTFISIHELKKTISMMEDEGEVFTLGMGSKRMIFLTNPPDDGL